MLSQCLLVIPVNAQCVWKKEFMDHADHIVAIYGRSKSEFPKVGAAGLQEVVSHFPFVNGLIMHLSFGHLDRGFESCTRYGYLSASLCILLFCVGRGFATG
jgi:hypothetical protein